MHYHYFIPDWGNMHTYAHAHACTHATGVTHFEMYLDDASHTWDAEQTVQHGALLKLLNESKIITLHSLKRLNFSTQEEQLMHCSVNTYGKVDWVGNWDIDEALATGLPPQQLQTMANEKKVQDKDSTSSNNNNTSGGNNNHHNTPGGINMGAMERRDGSDITAERQPEPPKLLVLVLTRRSAVAARQAIRETWGSGKHASSIKFVVGTACTVAPSRRIEHTCRCSLGKARDAPPGNDETEDTRTTNDAEEEQPACQTQAWTEASNAEDTALDKEGAAYGDLLRVDVVDVYRNLPAKLKKGYQWGVANTDAEWFVKVDDDNAVQTDLLARHLAAIGDVAEHHDSGGGGGGSGSGGRGVVVGHIQRGVEVPHAGKWAEVESYTAASYPPFPEGSYGYVVSRSIASYISSNAATLPDYQGEDVSLGMLYPTSIFQLEEPDGFYASTHF